MTNGKKSAFFLFLSLLLFVSCRRSEQPAIILNEQEYFSAPGFSFLTFQNNYQVGFQGGLQMIQNDERILDTGDFFLLPKAGNSTAKLKILRRVVDRQHSTVTLYGQVEGWGLGYQLVCRTDGQRIFVSLRLDQPLDWTRVQQAGFRIYLYPGAYFSKSYQSETTAGIFQRQFPGKAELLTSAKAVKVAQEDRLLAVSFFSQNSPLSLLDNRQQEPDPWFSVVVPLRPGSNESEVSLEIIPTIQRGWRRPPVIGISQVGYHPNQPKRIVLELDPQDSIQEPVRILRLDFSGERKPLWSANPKNVGRFLRYQYAVADFSEVHQPGLYWAEFRGRTAGPFRIDAAIFQEPWRPTLEYFLPVQMCHVAVKEGNRTWHGPCHLDDALQAPAGKQHFDGYQQGERETPFADNQHINGLSWGGWHDAGDHDLPAGSIAMTGLALVLAQEEFRPDVDETSIRRAAREVLLHVPDGRSDLLQQIEFGAESLLASFRIAGHIFPGIIETTGLAYGHMGDPINITDNQVYDPKLKPGEVAGERSGKFDDRWVFTNRNTGLQYQVSQTLAASSRVLRGFNDALAEECLKAAQRLWDYEQTHSPIYSPNSYVPGDSGFRSEELSAAGELLITTGKESYRQRLLGLLPTLRSTTPEQFGLGPGWVLVRALPQMKDPEFQGTVHQLAEGWKKVEDTMAASNPYGVPYSREVTTPSWAIEGRTEVGSDFVWGRGWELQQKAFQHYYFQKHMPELFSRDLLFNVVNFVLGCHPATNESFVSGVGTYSAPMAYGYNRADWSGIPGGIFSGSSLIKPDFMELKEFPFLWYQREYVIGGAATYIFDVLAADRWLSQ